ncbi:hypothetical protein IG631_04942 [Alternaria alternata]|nr:hypothetical protein IG631_04942 [Alternaria alternata]
MDPTTRQPVLRRMRNAAVQTTITDSSVSPNNATRQQDSLVQSCSLPPSCAILVNQANRCNGLSDLGEVAYMIDPTSQALIETSEHPHNVVYSSHTGGVYLASYRTDNQRRSASSLGMSARNCRATIAL